MGRLNHRLPRGANQADGGTSPLLGYVAAAGRLLAFAAMLAVAGPASADPVPSDDLIVGIDAYNAGDFATARRHLQAAADRGEAEAMVNLGYMETRGQGGPADPVHAFALYRRAAAMDDGEAMNAIGYRYQFGSRPDLAQAIIWYCHAIARGNPRAMNNLGLLAYRGEATPQDREAARDLWRQSMARGHLNAQVNLGLDLASDAAAAAADRRHGLDLLRDAATQGSAAAQEELRRNGDPGPFPPPSVTSNTMRLEPRGLAPGTSSLCGQVIS